MNNCKKKRKCLNIYLTDNERSNIERCAKRLGYKRSGKMIRDAILILSNNPSLDFLFDPGSLLVEEPWRIEIRQKFLMSLDNVLDLIQSNDLSIPEIDQGVAYGE